jgi:hypothetical protein
MIMIIITCMWNIKKKHKNAVLCVQQSGSEFASSILDLNLLNFSNNLSHLTVLTFSFRAVTKQSALPC